VTDTLESKRIVVATAGHVDHGKTSLVRALTGIDTDRLPEEKRRGISIELGFAELDGAGVSFIDAPGHERLVHTMIAGVGGVDAFLLVVAADDSVMPQTREHLAVCSVLGLTRVIVALSKCDLVDPETLDLAEEEVRETLARFGLEPVRVVRTSTETREGLSELEQSLRALVAQIPARAASARVWLSVDRAFSLRGVGTIVTGTLTRGTLREGDLIYLATERGVLESACRSLQLHGRRVSEVSAPTRIAINLARVDLQAVRRGDVITKDSALVVSRRLDALVHWLPGVTPTLTRKATLVAHLGTTRAQARVVRLGDDTAHLVLERAVPCEGGLGVVLRGLGARREFGRVLGGGRVLDALAAPPPRRRSARAFELRLATERALASGDMAGGLLGLIRCSEPRPVAEVDVERRLGLEPGSVASLLESCQSLALPLGDHPTWTTPQAVQRLLDAAVQLLRRYHAETPHELGAPLETIRTELARLGGRQAASHALEFGLESGRIRAVDTGAACLPDFAERTAQAHDEATEQVRATLDLVALAGASEQEVTERSGLSVDRARPALARLAKMGEARRLSGLWFGERRLASLRAAVRAHLLSHATLSVPTFKQLFAVSRKQAIPLLEDLDHQGVTRRKGDERVLGPAPDREK
jgi:selenocysteine-specific elongation factor